jgi:hypothetical protein
LRDNGRPARPRGRPDSDRARRDLDKTSTLRTSRIEGSSNQVRRNWGTHNPDSPNQIHR